MNDFTKEDLENMQLGLGWLGEHNPFHKMEISKLMTKLQSLIDNYCEHEWDAKHSSGFVVCNKCEKVYAEKV